MKNGSSIVKVCTSIEKARAVLNEWKDEQVDDLAKNDKTWEIITNDCDCFHITWDSGKHGIKIKVHPKAEVLK